MSPKVTEEYKEERKKEILKAAFEVFCKKGYEPTTMKDVVEASGFSRGGVYQYYSSTEEMFRDIINQYDQIGKEEIDTIILSADSIWSVITSFVNGYRETPTSNFAIVQFEFAVTSWRSESKDRLDFIYDRLEFWRENLHYIISEGVRRNEFKPVQPEQTIVDFMLNVFDSFVLQHQLGGKRGSNIDGQINALLFYLEKVLQINKN